MILKQHGLQRSGTNYLRYLLEENYCSQVFINKGGWKHGYYVAPITLGYEISCVLSVKNPYAWFISMYEYINGKSHKITNPKDRIGELAPSDANAKVEIGDKEWDKFLYNPLIVNGVIFNDKKRYECKMRAGNPIQYWNNMNYHWMKIKYEDKDLKTYIVRHEDLLENPEEHLNKTFGEIRKQKSDFRDTQNEALATWDAHKADEIVSKKSFADRKKYYLEKKYMDYYNIQKLAFIAKELDKEVMKVLKYEIVI